MRNVTMVVPVLIANCQVSLKSKIGPVTVQTSTTPTASTNTLGRPQKCAAAFANREYQVVLGMRTFFRAHEREVRLRWIEDGRSPREPWNHREEPGCPVALIRLLAARTRCRQRSRPMV